MNNVGEACIGCRSTLLHCINPDSPCFSYFCGEYPGTGKNYVDTKEQKKKE